MKKSQFQSHNPGLKILLIERTYALLEGNKYSQSNRIKAKALWTGINLYKDKFTWSGGGEIIPEVIDPQQKIQKIQVFEEPYGTHQVCQADFKAPLGAKEVIDFGYILKLEDKK